MADRVKGAVVLLAEGVHAAVTDRHGGVSAPPYQSRNLGGAVGDDPAAVRANRETTAAGLGLAPDRVVFMRQVHGVDVRHVTEPCTGPIDGPATDPAGTGPPPADAVFTGEAGLALAVLTADCAAVLLADPVARLVGGAHSGREGTAKGVVPALITAMAERGAEPSRMVALIGPVACGPCYEVSAELRAQVAATVPETWAATRAGTPALDLRAGITAQLARAGVGDVRHDDRCTIETPDLFSYRRERTTGRFAAYIWLEP